MWSTDGRWIAFDSYPTGIVKRGGLAASKVFRVHGAVAYDHSGKHAAFGAFNYSG